MLTNRLNPVNFMLELLRFYYFLVLLFSKDCDFELLAIFSQALSVSKMKHLAHNNRY